MSFKCFLYCYIAFSTFCFSQEKSTYILEVDTSVKFQTIAHFGASDAWSAQFVGQWPSKKKKAIAELLFSQKFNEDGKPEGIGLSLWRFNIGAGSAAQEHQSDIRDEWRRAESFLQHNGTYNWHKQAGQVWFAKQARKWGVEKLLLFSNSPPVSMTRNGKAYANKDESNLSSEKFSDFTKYLASIISGLQKIGLQVDYISPINEPQWDWSKPTQEGTPFSNNDIAKITRLLDNELEKNSLHTTIDIAEAAKINYLYEKADKPNRANQIQDFFSLISENYIGDLKHIGKAISGHSYFTTSPNNKAIESRKLLNQEIQKIPNLNYWMSEYCILGDNNGEINGSGRDLAMQSALYLARVIHNDLTVANASAWHWWLAISPYNYKDGLIYIDKNKEDGNYYESKMLWAFGNYSRFIRPNYQRVLINSVSENQLNSNLLSSAYVNPNTNEVTLVLVNTGAKGISTQINSGINKLKPVAAYITSETQSLSPYALKKLKKFTVPAESVLTILVK